MAMPIARGGWWNGAQQTSAPLPPPKPEHTTADTQSAIHNPSPPAAYFSASPAPSQASLAPGSVRSLLPTDAAKDAEPTAHPSAGLEPDDPRAEVIDQGYHIRDLDRQVNALADQQIDIEGAKRRMQAAQSAYEKLSPELQQKRSLVQREAEDALIHLEGQQLGQRLIQAQSKGSRAELSLVMADARLYVSGVRQVEASRKLQDALAVVMTPENRQALTTPEQKLRAAAGHARANHSDADAQEKLKTAQSEFDAALAGVLSKSDKHALDVLEAASKREQDLNEVLEQEADIEHRHYDMNQKPAGALNATEKRLLELTNTQYESVQRQREIRELGVDAASSTDEGYTQELLKKLDGALVEVMRQRAQTNVDRAQFNLEFVTQNATTPINVAKQFEVALPPQTLTVAEANKQLDAAKDQVAKLQEALKPPPAEPKGFWDRALDIGVGVLEFAVGAALTIGSGGLLAAAGVLIMADGAARTVHSTVDACNGTDTDTYQSQAMQSLFGMDRGAANRVDAGISLLAMAPGMGVGALKLIAQAGKLAKVAGTFGAVTTLDTVQAQLRYAAFNDATTPFAVQGLTSLGMSHTAANYVMLAGGVASTAGLASAAARARPGRTELAFKEFNQPGDAAAAARVADWYGRNAPEDIRRSVASELLGPNASARQIARETQKLGNQSLVVIRDGAEGGGMLGAAVLQANSRGRFGLDPVGDKVGKRTTEVRDVVGDDLSMQQALAAAVVGVDKFTNQNAITWNTTDSLDSRLTPGAVISGQRVRRDALDTFNRMSEADRPEAVNRALDSSSSPEAQLRALAEISTNDRYAWPAQTRDLVYKRVFNRPPALFGNETLGKIVHVMDKQSYVNQFNSWANPAKRAVGLWEKSHPRVREIETFPAEGGRPAMAATLNKSNSLAETALYEIASASIESRRLMGADTDALSRIPERERVTAVMDDLRTKDVITIRDEHGNLIAGGAMSRRGDRAISDTPRGTVHVSNLFTTGEGWGPLMAAAEKAATQQGARQLSLDSALPHLIEMDPRASSFVQAAHWNTRDYFSHARASTEAKVAALKESFGNIDSRHLDAMLTAGRTAGTRVSGAGHWLSEHLNPYSYPAGLEPGAWRGAIQDAGRAARCYAKQGIHLGRSGILLSLGPQAAAGQMYFVTNDDRTVLPFNGLPNSSSLALYFDWTGTMITLWGNGPNARGPAPLDPNGLQPLMRIRPALNDPNGPNSAGILATGRLILGGEVNLGVRYFGSNDGVSAQSAMSLRLGRVNSNLRADVPVQPGGPKGFSLIGSLTALAPSMSHAAYVGPFGATVRTPRVTMIGTLQTAPLSAADQNAAFRAGEHHTRGAKGVSGGTGFYFTLNPAYAVPDFSPR